MATQIQIRRDISANWSSQNPTLAQGEIGLEMETAVTGDKTLINGIKVGDGETAWTSLEYAVPVFEHPNTVVDNENITMYLKGKSGQTGMILQVENNAGESLLAVKEAASGEVHLLHDNDGTVKVGGGYGSTGISMSHDGTIQTDGDITSANLIQAVTKTLTSGTASSGDNSGIVVGTDTNFGKVLSYSKADAADTDVVRSHTDNGTLKWEVTADGAQKMAGGYVADTGTGVTVANNGNIQTNGTLSVDGLLTLAGGLSGVTADRSGGNMAKLAVHAWMRQGNENSNIPCSEAGITGSSDYSGTYLVLGWNMSYVSSSDNEAFPITKVKTAVVTYSGDDTVVAIAFGAVSGAWADSYYTQWGITIRLT